ncbi:MAG: ATP-binding protein [Ignavibacteriales bacterium]|nr:ATP-binding protein [Ignavibacteriales bacterium]
MSLKKLFIVLLGIQFILVVVLMVLTLFQFQNQGDLNKSRDIHFKSYLLADELRQSSDDLSRMARTYVVTGNTEHERDYWTILDIRNGKSPRPVSYNRIYWDFKVATGQKPRPDGEAISLQDLMIKEGFTKAEFEKLSLAQKNSDGLVKTEMIAMNAVKGLFDDGSGNFTVKKKPDREMAIRIMNDEAYYTNKAEIMKPIDEFYVMFEKRTATDVAKYEQRSTNLLWYSTTLIIIIMGMFIIFFVAIERQITTRMHSEEALRESEDSYRDLVENSSDLIITHDLDGNLLSSNGTALKIIGYSKDEIINMNLQNIIVPEYRRLFNVYLDNIKRIGHARGLMIIQTKTGEKRIWEYNNTLRTEGIAKPIVRGMAKDVTEQKRAELERRVLYEITHGVTTTANLDELLKLIHNSLKKIIYAENCFVALNDQTTELFSFPYFVDKFDPTPEPVAMRKSCSAYVFKTGKSLLLTQKLFDQLVEQDEVELVGTNSPSWIGVPLQTPSKTIGVLVLQHYEEENVYTERDVKFLDTVGSQIAIVIERKLAEKEIKKRNEQLSKLNSEKDKFFSIIAHDLKNPFVTILGFSELLLADYAELNDEERKYYIEEMKKSADLSHNLLQNLLLWSRAQTGRIEFNPQKLNLHNIFHENLDLVKATADRKQIQLNHDLPDDITLIADEDMLNTIIRNLLTNAIKFTNKGGTISVKAVSNEHDIEIAVADSGVGMDQKTIDNLFRLDVTSSASGTESESGTGLGLILCKEFVEKNNGKIWVESELGKGSTFYFNLPNAE